jgi:hypothetical protein
MSVLGASLLGLGCNIAGISKQEDLGRGIVWGTLGDQRSAMCGSQFQQMPFI